MQFKKIIGPSITIVVASTILIVMNMFIAPVAQDKQLASKQQYFKLIYPAAKQFSPVSTTHSQLQAYVAQQNGMNVGIVYEITVKGYKYDIVFFIGINRDGTLEKPVYSSLNDTPGIGTKVETDNDFGDQFLETTIDDFYLDTISSATITSQAVVDGTQLAVQAFGQMKTILE